MLLTEDHADPEPWEMAARERVRDLYAAYNHAGDRFRVADLADCFAADGVLAIRGQEPVTGRAAILGLLSGVRRGPTPDEEVPQLRHFVANLLFTDVTPDRITSEAYFQVFTQHGPDHWGRYRDAVVRTADGWRFAHRTVIVDAALPGSWYEGQTVS
ncbi:hypothetical protein BH11ACT8_BH11ACT8_08760 [soil metagenome]